MKDIWIYAPNDRAGGELDDAICRTPYMDRVVVLDNLRDIHVHLGYVFMGGYTIHFGFQGEWWLLPEIHDILRAMKENLGPNHVRWLPDNWFLPKSMLPELTSPDEVYSWIESQL